MIIQSMLAITPLRVFSAIALAALCITAVNVLRSKGYQAISRILYGVRHIFPLVFAAALLSACGGGGGSDEGDDKNSPPTSTEASGPLPTSTEAFRFLNQASMGATKAEAQRVASMGYEAWIDEQMQIPASLSLPYVKASIQSTGDVEPGSRVGAWIHNALYGRDQLRQRVALALSEILVVSSQQGALELYKWQPGVADYYDLLSKNAFGNYRDLMEGVTLHPAMGKYLSMRGNLKADLENNIRPDENYARELMQLFTIGLVELNIDGSAKKNSNGRPIPTYNQKTVQEFARVFTGWDYQETPDDQRVGPEKISRTMPMQ
jgi:uncharacterized protein (DUF1800 family)